MERMAQSMKVYASQYGPYCVTYPALPTPATLRF